jgi:hypothetical protein
VVTAAVTVFMQGLSRSAAAELDPEIEKLLTY